MTMQNQHALLLLDLYLRLLLYPNFLQSLSYFVHGSTSGRSRHTCRAFSRSCCINSSLCAGNTCSAAVGTELPRSICCRSGGTNSFRVGRGVYCRGTCSSGRDCDSYSCRRGLISRTPRTVFSFREQRRGRQRRRTPPSINGLQDRRSRRGHHIRRASTRTWCDREACSALPGGACLCRHVVSFKALGARARVEAFEARSSAGRTAAVVMSIWRVVKDAPLGLLLDS